MLSVQLVLITDIIKNITLTADNIANLIISTSLIAMYFIVILVMELLPMHVCTYVI